MATPTPKQMAAAQRRSLKALEAKLRRMASDWDGLDEYFVTILEEAADKLKDVQVDLRHLPDPSEG